MNSGALDRLSSNWDAMAELDPLWAILSDPQKKFGRWDLADFFADGEREARRVIDICEKNGIRVSYGKMLDFGCGAGRMTRAFSSFFGACIGIDVSGKMTELARKFNSDRQHCEFLVANEEPILPFQDGSFDFVFSVLVLQHLPKESLILAYISEFLRVAKHHGVVVFQLTSEVPFLYKIQLRRRLWSLLAFFGTSERLLFRVFGLAPIRMNGVAREKIEAFVGTKSARVVAVEQYDSQPVRYPSNYYFVLKEGSAK